MLLGVKIRFDTHDDDKDAATVVHVFVRNRWSNSLTPQNNTDFITNWFALNHYLPAGPPTGQQNPYLAYKLFIGADDPFEGGSSRAFDLDLAPPERGVDDVILPEVSIHILTDQGSVAGDDRWIFDYTVTMYFDEGSYSFSSTDDGVRGIILDQDNRNYTGIGRENHLRTMPPPETEIAKAKTDAVLREVTLEFATRSGDDNNKNPDTRLNVHIVNRLSESSAQDIAIGLDLFHDQEFPDSGPREDLYRKFIWSAHDNTLASKKIRLADMVLPMVYISIAPTDDDTWNFEYRVTFEFGRDHMPNEKRYVYSWRSDGIVLDQDNPKHAGVYQGPPFPTVTPASAPALTYQPVDRTGDNKKRISLTYLRRRLDDFINNRTGIPTIDPNPPLWRIDLGSTPFDEDYPLPESYYDLQSLVNDNGGGIDYVSGPGSLGQITSGYPVGNTYIKRVEGESIKLQFSYESITPFLLTLTFKTGGVLEMSDTPGDTHLDTFYVTIGLTLDIETIVDPVTTKTRSTVDVFSWVPKLAKNNDNLLHQVIMVHLVTDSVWGKTVRDKIAQTIYDKLTSIDVITNRSRRDDINSIVTSWLLGGVADDEQDTDENNSEIESVDIEGGWSRPWDTIIGFSSSSPTPITAIARTSDHVDLFVAGRRISDGIDGEDDGRIYTTYRDVAGPWADWLPISPSFVNAGTPVSVLARTPDHMDLFVAGSHGRVYTTYWDSGTPWSTDPWMPISPSFVNAATPVTVLARTPDHMDLFVAGSDGKVYTTYWDSGTPWSTDPWMPISPSFVNAATPVTVLARTPDHMDLFVAGSDGRVYTTYWDSGTPWSTDPWMPISPSFVRRATPVTVLARTPDHMDLFVAGSDGRVYTTYWDSGTPWSTDPWMPISPSFVSPRTPVSVLARIPDHMDLFVAGSDGKVYTSWWDSGTAWSTDPWNAISPVFVDNVPVRLTAIARTVDHMDVFASDSAGNVDFKTWDNAEEAIVLSYKGPKNIFVAKPPVDWPAQGRPSAAYDFAPSTLWNIDHIVVLTKENRSFDHVLGYLSLAFDQGGMGRTEVDGLKGTEFNTYKGTNYYVKQLRKTLFAPGPPNGYEAVEHAINRGRMDRFVRSHAELNNDEVAGEVMGYHTAATVPVYDALARDFAIGHRWFASHPGPTYPNRFYELTGRPNLDPRGFWEFHNASPKRPVFTKTIFDYLDGAVDPKLGTPITWRYFEDGVCTLRFYERYTFDHEHIVDFGDLENGFYACARSGRLPSVSFIDPHFVDLPPGSNCDEPPSDMAHGQQLAQGIVEAVVSGPAWRNTLLLIVYDEHGGFYDHVPPPQAAKVSEDFPIETFGLRVPVFVISPWVAAGSVFGSAADPKQFDHMSILKTIVRRFLPDNPPYLGARYAMANDLSSVLTTDLRASQFLPFVRHRLQNVGSSMMLTADRVEHADETDFSQLLRSETIDRDFSFEDAGDGFVYIRSHVGNRYLTARQAWGTGGEAMQRVSSTDVDVVLDSKFGAAHGELPARQMWKIVRTVPRTGPVLASDLYVISNRAFPHLALHPVVAGGSESLAVLFPCDVREHPGDAFLWKVIAQP